MGLIYPEGGGGFLYSERKILQFSCVKLTLLSFFQHKERISTFFTSRKM